MNFKDFNLSKEMLEALEKKGFVTPSEIQKMVIPELLKEKTHLIGQAQTGTGKNSSIFNSNIRNNNSRKKGKSFNFSTN